jgi:hypothetical protein
MKIPLSKEELLSAHNRGVLEGLLLGHGILPLKALESILESYSEEKDCYAEEIAALEKEVEDLLEQISYLEEVISEGG